MRYLAVAACLFSVACADAQYQDGDVTTMEVMSQRLEEAMPPPPPGEPDVVISFTDERTFPCLDGEVVVKVQWSHREKPYSRKYYVSWDYDECVTWQHGTIDGDARYSTAVEDKSTFWFTGVSYYADLDYIGTADSECDAYMQMSKKTLEQHRELKLRDHCPHPVLFWWALWGVPQF